MNDGTDPEADRNFVTALARGLEVLRCFGEHEVVLTNHDFAERTGLPKATISRLTHTLVKLDYLAVDPRSGGYRLAPNVLQLGFSVLSSLDVATQTEIEMQRLRAGPNPFVTVSLAERAQLNIIFVAVEAAREDVALRMRIGAQAPLFETAIGRVILAAGPADERERLLAEAQDRDPAGQDRRVDILKRSLAEYEATGCCTGFRDWRQDVNAIATPVWSLDRSRIFGLSTGGPTFHVQPDELRQTYGPMLVEAGRRLGVRSARTA